MVTTYRTSYACGGCNWPVSKDATYCPHCNALLRGMHCTKCGFVGHPDQFVNSLCPKCGVFCAIVRQQRGTAPRPATPHLSRIERRRARGKSPLGCLLASFLVPGLGTSGASDHDQPDRSVVVRRAIVIFAAATVLLLGGAFLGTANGMPAGLGDIFAAPVWLWGMVDAYRTARKWNRAYASPAGRGRLL